MLDDKMTPTTALDPAKPRSGAEASRRHPCDDPIITSAEALDAAYRGQHCELVRADGSSRLVPATRWSGRASQDDIALFVDPCGGPTLDVGCGPGRLTHALAMRGLDVLGIDISPEAVRQTRQRGAPAVCQDIFDEHPTLNPWRHIVLADGNVGLGGDPVRLLRRIADLLLPGGTVLVELAGPGHVRLHDDVKLRVGQRATRPFRWATVGTHAIAELAAASGLRVAGMRHSNGRPVATLRHQLRLVGQR
jgi:SAM-dependent methyltransferase